MVRSAAKNYQHVAVVTDPADYAPRARRRCASASGAIGAETRFRLAQKAFSHTAAYDGAISNYLTALDAAGGERERFPGAAQPPVRARAAAALRREPAPARRVLPRSAIPRRAASRATRQLQGKELSYNNIADADAAWECVKTFDAPACVIVKHANPVRRRGRRDTLEARTARRSRPIRRRPSAASSRSTASSTRRRPQAVCEQFVEVVIAPAVATGARCRSSRARRTCACSTVPAGRRRERARLQARRRRPARADAGRARTSTRPSSRS